MRIEPLDPDAAGVDEDTRRRLDSVRSHAGGELSSAHTLIANSPSMYRGWLTLGSQIMLRGSLEPRRRELVILRTAHNNASSYEWAAHRRIARNAGLTNAEIDDLATARPTMFSGIERALIDAADALAEHSHVDDPTWKQLADVYPPSTLVEILMIVGHYTTTTYVLRSLGLEES